MAGRIDDVYLRAFPVNRTVLGRDGDASLTFQLQAVHDPVIDFLSRPDKTALSEHGVNKRGLPVVHVGNNGDVTHPGVSHKTTHSTLSLLKAASKRIVEYSLF